MESITQRKPMIKLGDFNDRIGNKTLPGVKQRFNEGVLNNHGQLLIKHMCKW